MSPRIIHMPLSGGDRKAQAKARREARGISGNFWTKSLQARGIAEAKAREADRYLSDAWTSLVFWGEPTRFSPTIAQAINGGRPLLWAQCQRCNKEPVIDLRQVKRKPERTFTYWKQCSYVETVHAVGNSGSAPTSLA